MSDPAKTTAVDDARKPCPCMISENGYVYRLHKPNCTERSSMNEPLEDNECEHFIGTEELKAHMLRSRLMGMDDAEKAYSAESFQALEDRISELEAQLSQERESKLVELESIRQIKIDQLEAQVTQLQATNAQLMRANIELAEKLNKALKEVQGERKGGDGEAAVHRGDPKGH